MGVFARPEQEEEAKGEHVAYGIEGWVSCCVTMSDEL
jgi:hypothetical protein